MVFYLVNFALYLVALISHHANLLTRVFQIGATVLDSLLVRHARLSLDILELLKSDLFINCLARVLILLA
jgi:hypothetical protein